jgi:hypothetical protein
MNRLNFLKIIPFLPLSAVRAEKKDTFQRKIIYKSPFVSLTYEGERLCKTIYMYMLECNHDINIRDDKNEGDYVICEKCKAFNLFKNK